ncbi:oxygenase MpaB family protein [Mycobacteroides salmoniphilum]|uniref:oxygenase MpaB family protein n=1 Tax=Mycobacteroides salmoniphilum TaxID=404941 RepID=UPI001065C04C|nr:oxygenase MpaB family protein [Mycobacteroides salmoniphilum]TDZ76382.1 hypothetical protein DE4586_04289 [Mycobacteroides salmoniphilum]TDZ84900.1 hypothetical protein DE4587_03827 [Mycobacteroides salmoniphilum]
MTISDESDTAEFANLIAYPAVLLGKLVPSRIWQNKILPSANRRRVLDHYTHVFERYADDLVAAMSRLPKGVGRQQFDTALELGIDAVEDPLPELVSFLREMKKVPDWLDEVGLRRGQAAINSVPIQSAIFTAMSIGFPYTYFYPDTNIVLMTMGGLHERAASRCMETINWLYDFAKPDSLNDRSDGFKTTARIRLIHAYVRAGMKDIATSAEWDHEQPANLKQHAFTIIPLIGLSLLTVTVGYPLTYRKLDSIIHIFRHQAHLLGVPEELQIRDARDLVRMTAAAVSTGAIRSDQYTRPLCEAMIDAIPVMFNTARYGSLAPLINRVWLESFSVHAHLIGGRKFAKIVGYPPIRPLGLIGYTAFTAKNLASFTVDGLRYIGRPEAKVEANARARTREIERIARRVEIDNTYNREGVVAGASEKARKIMRDPAYTH